jgi:2-C-methyl-D-erythritol 2,4-cyclodiphosphate synthase
VRTGIGYDIHRFDPSRTLVLGGVVFEGEAGLAGHSDADVLLHAIIDALLGAAGLGDIGTHFPPGDPKWAGADSGVLLVETLRMVREMGLRPVNVDSTVVAEKPRLAGRIPEIRERIAELLGLPEGHVNVKATTNEGLGDIGRGEGIAAMAVALVEASQAGA